MGFHMANTIVAQITEQMLAKTEYEGNDPESFASIVRDALEIYGRLSAKTSSASAPASSGKVASVYVRAGQVFNKGSDADRTRLSAAIGSVTLSAGTKYAENTRKQVDALDEDKAAKLFTTFDSAQEAYTTIRACGFQGFAVMAMLWANMTDDQRKAAKGVLDGVVIAPTSGAIASRAAATTRAASATVDESSASVTEPVTGSSTNKNGHNAIKTIISVVLDMKDVSSPVGAALARLMAHADFSGRKNGMQIGIGLWNKVKERADQVNIWHTTCADLPADKTARIAMIKQANSPYFKLLTSTIDLFYPA